VITFAAVAIVVWGALAFGAVYPWAYIPLLAACASAGALGLLLHRRKPFTRSSRAAVIALSAVVLAGLLQVVPLPAGLLKALSPATDAFLRSHDFSYAFGGNGGGVPGSESAPGAWHPLSLAPRASLVGLALLAAFTLFLAGLIRALSRSRSGVRRLAGFVVAFGVLLAVVGIVQKAMLGDHAWGGMRIYGFWSPANMLSTPFGPYVNKNHFAGWMLMGVPLALGLALGMAEQGRRQVAGGWRSAVLWLSSPDGGRMQLIVLAVLIMGASLLMTRSRSGVAAFGLAIIVVSIVTGRRFGSVRAGLAALASLGVLFFTVFLLAGGDFAARIVNRMDAMELRRNIWSDSAAIIRDFPLAGTGLNSFGTAMISYQSSQHDQHFQEAHNDYLQLMVEGGLLLALPALVALVMVVLAIRRRFAAGDDDPVTWWIRVGATTGLLAIAAQSCVEFSLQMPGNTALFVVLLAIAMHEAPSRKGLNSQLSTRNSEVTSPKSGQVLLGADSASLRFGVGSWEVTDSRLLSAQARQGLGASAYGRKNGPPARASRWRLRLSEPRAGKGSVGSPGGVHA
jgi:O-antigen ligase